MNSSSKPGPTASVDEIVEFIFADTLAANATPADTLAEAKRNLSNAFDTWMAIGAEPGKQPIGPEVWTMDCYDIQTWSIDWQKRNRQAEKDYSLAKEHLSLVEKSFI